MLNDQKHAYRNTVILIILSRIKDYKHYLHTSHHFKYVTKLIQSKNDLFSDESWMLVVYISLLFQFGCDTSSSGLSFKSPSKSSWEITSTKQWG